MMTLSISIKEINTEELGHCVIVSNERLQIVVTIDYGPRIVSVTKYAKPYLQ